MKKAIVEALRIGGKQADSNRERQAGRGEPPPGQPRGRRTEVRRHHAGDVEVSVRHFC